MALALQAVDAGGVLAVLADAVVVGDLDFGYRAPLHVDDLVPELAGVGLGFGDGGPVVAHVLVFAG